MACGQEYKLPPQPSPQPIPEAGRYHYDTTWSLPSPGDLAIWGSYLFAIVNTKADTSQQVDRLQVFLTSRPEPTPPPVGGFRPFLGLLQPVRVCVALQESIYVFVADAGDMKVKRYLFTGGSPRFEFTDPHWKDFSGLAADSNLTVYVSDATRDTIAAYDREGHLSRVISSWGRGSGFVIHPHGVNWDGEELLAADTEQQRVVRLRTDATATSFGEPVSGQGSLRPLAPVDVGADPDHQFIYVADSGGGHGPTRILKYLLSGAFVDSVYSSRVPPAGMGAPIDSVRFIAIQDKLVFASDPDNNRLVAFVRADSL